MTSKQPAGTKSNYKCPLGDNHGFVEENDQPS